MRSKKKPQTPVTRAEKRDAIALLLKEFPELADRVIARSIGSSHSHVGKIRAELGLVDRTDNKDDWLQHTHIKAHPELLEGASERTLRALSYPGVLDLMAERAAQGRKMGARYAQATLRREANEEKERAAKRLTAQDIHTYCADVFDGLPWIDSESLDACIVDPPYDRAAVKNGLYRAIAEVAARVLKPNAALVVMCGHAYLDKIIQQISEVEGLSYLWLVHYVTKSGGSPYVNRRGAFTYAKPCLVYVKNASPVWTGAPYSDLIETEPPTAEHQQFHPQQQDVRGMQELVKRFCPIEGTVLDMCMGSGTTGVAAVRLRRKFIGIDISSECVETARARLLAALEEQAIEG